MLHTYQCTIALKPSVVILAGSLKSEDLYNYINSTKYMIVKNNQIQECVDNIYA